MAFSRQEQCSLESDDLPRSASPASEPRPSPTSPPPVGAAMAGGTVADLTPIVGANLRRLRVKRGLSLERLAKQSGVSRAMLGQVELGQSTPTINVLWKISLALDVPFSALLGKASQGPTVSVLPLERAQIGRAHV